MAKIHMVCGPVGAGKTTLAKKLSRENGAMLFSIDQWMTTLFTPDLKGEIDYDWAMARIGRMEELIWSHVRQGVVLGVGAVLDLGLLQRSHREKFYALAAQEGFEICLHLVEADPEIRWQRVMVRNQEQGDMPVDRGMFDFCEGLFERPAGDELSFTIIH